MSIDKQTALQMAKNGDEKVIALLVNRSLKPQGITARTQIKGDCLKILLESDRVPEENTLTELLTREISGLGIYSVETLRIYGRQKGEPKPAWIKDISILQVDFTSRENNASIADNNASSSRPVLLKGHYHESPQKSSRKAQKALSIFWKWYSSGFKSRPDKCWYASPRAGRIALTYFLIFIIIPSILELPSSFFTTQNSADETLVSSSAPSSNPLAAEATTAAENIAEPSEPTNLLQDAVNKATAAANAAQTAKIPEQWLAVSTLWQEASSFMAAIPTHSSNYETAQKKVAEYGANAESAATNAAQLKQTYIEKGKQIFENLKGRTQTAGELTPRTLVRLIIPRSKWDTLSISQQVSVTYFAQSVISSAKENPSQFIDIPTSASGYPIFIQNISNICSDCWRVYLSDMDDLPYSMDEIVVEGDSLWQQNGPSYRGEKGSSFREKLTGT